MRNIAKKITGSFFILMFFLSSFIFPLISTHPVYASGSRDSKYIICEIFPFLDNIVYVNNALCAGDTTAGKSAVSDLLNLAKFALSFIFVGIIAVAVYVVVKASIRYIRSEGNEEEVQAAQKAIKQVFAGIAALFIGLIGLVIILSLFNATGAINDKNEVDPNNVPLIKNITQ
jgi:heme/copper-type cytochrome/quinol oxidase subunit 2